MSEMQAVRAPRWEEIPDLGLYMDQVITFLARYVPGDVTAGMVNSYVKAGVIDRPNGKKYSRESLAQLVMVCFLKPVTPLEALRQLLHPAEGDAEALYGRFAAGRERLCEQVRRDEKGMSALDCAIIAAELQAMCRTRLAQETAAGGKAE